MDMWRNFIKITNNLYLEFLHWTTGKYVLIRNFFVRLYKRIYSFVNNISPIVATETAKIESNIQSVQQPEPVSQPTIAGVETMNFAEALVFLKQGFQVERAGWNGKGMYVALQMPDAASKMTLPYLYLKTADGKFVPWTPSHTDSLATDWSFITKVGA